MISSYQTWLATSTVVTCVNRQGNQVCFRFETMATRRYTCSNQWPSGQCNLTRAKIHLIEDIRTRYQTPNRHCSLENNTSAACRHTYVRPGGGLHFSYVSLLELSRQVRLHGPIPSCLSISFDVNRGFAFIYNCLLRYK